MTRPTEKFAPKIAISTISEVHQTSGLARGMAVYDSGAPLHVPVSPECLGRMVNIFGEPLDGGPVLPAEHFRNIHSRPPGLYESLGTSTILETKPASR